MKFKGGYGILLDNAPEDTIDVLPQAKVLYLPLVNGRLNFTDILVSSNDNVKAGQVLARDPDNYSLPYKTAIT